MADLSVGFARARLGPAAAVIDVQRNAVAACEENRITRARQVGAPGPPELALSELLASLDRTPADISSVGVVTGEDRQNWANAGNAVLVDGHDAHARYAFRASGFDEAVVVV